IVGLPSMPPGASLPPMADDDFAPATLLPDAPPAASAQAPAVTAADPSAAVSLPRPGTEKGTGPRDVLAGWGWGSDSHPAIIDDAYAEEDSQRTSRKRLLIAIGGAIGAIA